MLTSADAALFLSGWAAAPSSLAVSALPAASTSQSTKPSSLSAPDALPKSNAALANSASIACAVLGDNNSSPPLTSLFSAAPALIVTNSPSTIAECSHFTDRRQSRAFEFSTVETQSANGCSLIELTEVDTT